MNLRPRTPTHGRRPCGAPMWSAPCWRRARSGPAVPRPVSTCVIRSPVRALVLMLVVTTFIAAGGERGRRLAAAFDWHGVVVPANFRLDAWVSPATYTAKPPVILPGLRPANAPKRRLRQCRFRPAAFWWCGPGKVQFNVATTGGVAEVPAEQRPQAPTGTEERRYLITDRRHRHGARPERRRSHLCVQRHTGQAAGDRAHQGPGAPGKRIAAAQLQDGRRYGVVEAKALFALKERLILAMPAKGGGRRRTAPAICSARDAAHSPAGAGQERRRPDHQGFEAITRGPAPRSQ